MLKNIIFIGSHLSRKNGTKGMAEKIAYLLEKECNISLVSFYQNKMLRLIDIMWSLIIKKFDIVHIDIFSNKAFIYADIASRIATIKTEQIVMTLHGGMLAEKYESNPKYVHSVLERADIVQSPSLFLIEFFKKQNIEVKYMPNFIDLSNFPYDRKEVKQYSLLWVRAFSPEYRPELAVRTLFELLKKYPQSSLIMVGPDKGSLPETVKLVKELDLADKILFVGQVSNEELYKYYQSHSIYLNTTAYESFGVAVLEAAACGIPIVSTKVGEIPYIWEEEKEILLCDANAIIMAEKVTEIFASSELAKKMSLNARKKAESFDWKNVKKQWIALLKGDQ